MGKVQTKNKRRKRKCTKKNKRTRKKRGNGSNRCQIFRQQQEGEVDKDERVFDQIEADDYCYVIEGHPNEQGIAGLNYCNKEGVCVQKDGGIDLHPVGIPLLERQDAIDPDEFMMDGGKKRIKRKRRRKSTKKKRRRRRRCTKKKRKKR